MSILFLILPLTILVAAAAVAAYVWSARAGQFDDLDTPAVRMLHDDDAMPPHAASRPKQQ
ncbi:MAG: cbb3-type cytochrome oxidase assembly protein CcoS [Gemmatimonadales bacterium]